MGTKQYDKTIPELKLLMTKAKESGRPDVAAGIAKIIPLLLLQWTLLEITSMQVCKVK